MGFAAAGRDAGIVAPGAGVGAAATVAPDGVKGAEAGGIELEFAEREGKAGTAEISEVAGTCVETVGALAARVVCVGPGPILVATEIRPAHHRRRGGGYRDGRRFW